MKPGANILVIDDSPDARLMLKEVLEGKGHFVFEAADGQEALDLMSKTLFHLAIVDLDMPRMNGIEFSRKAKDANPRFPIVMVTAYSQFYTPADILASGVDAFLQKPLDLSRLFRIIDQL
jgi:CheY-like chemotaxis protein